MIDLTFCLMTCGEETEAECLAAIEPFRDKIVFQEVRNVFPQITALNAMFDQVTTPYLIPLDSDMILDSNAYERIRMAVDKFSHDSTWHSILFHLWDTLTEQEILALKVLRTSVVKKYPFKDSPTPDVLHYKDLTDAGYKSINRYLEKPPIGKHVVKGPFFCYNKYRDVYMTLRRYGKAWDEGVFKGGRTFLERSKRHFDFFLSKYAMTMNYDYMYCIAGMVDGITSDAEDCSKSLSPKSYKIRVETAIDQYLDWYKDRLHYLDMIVR